MAKKSTAKPTAPVDQSSESKKSILDTAAENSEVTFGELKAVGAENGDQKEIRIAVAGVGNCASALIQGIEFYKNIKETDMYINGLMNPSVGGYLPRHMKVVAAFEINTLKIGKDLGEAIYADPITTPHIISPEKFPKLGVTVQAGPILDGVADHMVERFHCYDPKKMTILETAKVLRDAKVQILVNYMPVGSFQAARYYAQAALDAGCGFINCIPEFIISEHLPGDKDWVAEFIKKGLPCAGDDIKSQVGATIMHRMLSKLFLDRGVIVKDTYQLNIGGDTDFENMKKESRLTTKRKSKTAAVTSVLPYLNDTTCRIGPSDFVTFLRGKKICYIRMNGVTFGNLPLEVDVKMRVEDSGNSAGVVMDIIRVMKLALNRKISGRLDSISSFSFKHPPIQPPSDVLAKTWVAEFIEGKRDR